MRVATYAGIIILSSQRVLIEGVRHMERIIKALLAVAVLGLSFGCSSTGWQGERVTPTHRWLAEADVSIAKYNSHNKACVDATNVNINGAQKNTPAFVAYEQCMKAKGYKLVASNH